MLLGLIQFIVGSERLLQRIVGSDGQSMSEPLCETLVCLFLHVVNKRVLECIAFKGATCFYVNVWINTVQWLYHRCGHVPCD